MSETRPITFDACRREIETLHAFFGAWYRDERESFDRMERALAPGFEMITPDGDRVDRESILAAVREGRGKHATDEFTIEIREVEELERTDDLAVVCYEEWQTTTGDETGRVSTACFRPSADAPEGVVWTALQETWL